MKLDIGRFHPMAVALGVAVLAAAGGCAHIGGSSGGGDEGDAGPPDAGPPVSIPVAFDDLGVVSLSHGGSGAIAMVDVNGDRKEDVVLVEQNGDGTESAYVDLSSGHSFDYVGQTWTSPLAAPADNHDWRFADVNGDGLPDFVETTLNGDSTKDVYVSLGQGTSWSYVGQPYTHGSTDGALYYLTMDINGDGKDDWLQVGQNGDGSRKLSPALSDGSGGFTRVLPDFDTPDLDPGSTLRSLDVNGDGGVDWVEISGDGANNVPMSLYLSYATQTGAYGYAGSPVEVPAAGQVENWLVMDVDGDGKEDLVESYTDSMGVEMLEPLLSTGTNFGRATPAPAPAAQAQDVNLTSVCDLNGDGRTDYLAIIGSGVMPRTVVAVLGTPTGLVSATRSYTTTYADAADAIYIADVNGDGKSDLLQYAPAPSGATPHRFHLLLAK